MAKRRSFALRIDGKTYDAMRRWAKDDLRSLNAQIEFVLRDALQKAGRLPGRSGETDRADGDSMD